MTTCSRPGVQWLDRARNSGRRFDEEALTMAVATDRRAENALEQFEEHAAGRQAGRMYSRPPRRRSSV